MERSSQKFDDLIPRLQAAAGVLKIVDPPIEVRAAYRRAISAVIRAGLVPEGLVLRHTGRDRGDMTIRLVPALEAPAARPKPSRVPVPGGAGPLHPAVRELSEREDLLAVSRGSRPRAVLILQGIAAEADRRGYVFGLRGDGKPGFCLAVGEDSYEFAVAEEYDTAEIFPEEEVADRKYSWQRVSSRPQAVPSGRLAIAADHHYSGPGRWADRKRRSLVDKLPQLFLFVDEQARASRQRRAEAAQRQQDLHESWQTAVDNARQAYLEEFNRQRLLAQADGWCRAPKLRAYAAAVRTQAEQLTDEESQRLAVEWAAWALHEADRMDPFTSPGELHLHTPYDIPAEDLDRFMPKGMTARHAPEGELRRYGLL